MWCQHFLRSLTDAVIETAHVAKCGNMRSISFSLMTSPRARDPPPYLRVQAWRVKTVYSVHITTGSQCGHVVPVIKGRQKYKMEPDSSTDAWHYECYHCEEIFFTIPLFLVHLYTQHMGENKCYCPRCYRHFSSLKRADPSENGHLNVKKKNFNKKKHFFKNVQMTFVQK